MKALMIIGITLAALALLLLLLTYICYFLTFYSPKRKPLDENEFVLPQGKIYEPYGEKMKEWTRQARSMPHEEFSIRSHDGLTLYGNYYEYQPGAVIELMMHGYRGSGERDLCGGVQRCFSLGRSCLVVDQRAAGASDGHTITFGILERRDCLKWVNFMIEHFGPEVKIILTGISMGAATVLMAGGMELPPNVIGIIADCGYTTPKEIIQKVMKQIHVPVRLLYPFVKLGARLFGRFDLEETSALEAMEHCKVPVFFTHGQNDHFVPYEMTVRNYQACSAQKKLLSVPEAGHGLCYMLAPEEYRQALLEMEQYYKK